MLVYIFYINIFFQQVAIHTIFVNIGSFVFKISDPALGATYVTTYYSMVNFGKYFIEPFAIALLDYIPFFTLNIIGMVYQSAFIYFNYHHVLELDKTDINKFFLFSSEGKELENL